MSCVLMIQIHQRIDFKTILPMMITTMIVQYFSTGYLFHFTDHSLKIILGIIMIFFAAMFAFPHKHWPEKIPTVFHILAGGITGICGSLGVGGPPLGYYCHSIFSENTSYMMNLQFCLLVTSGFLFVQHFAEGAITGTMLLYCAIASIICIMVLMPTMKLFRKLNRERLTKIIILFLITMGIINFIM